MFLQKTNLHMHLDNIYQILQRNWFPMQTETALFMGEPYFINKACFLLMFW